MDTLFPLTIFPTGGLASSIITTVWVGIIVISFYNLRFGTTLSGLVVPGYLIPLFIVKPISAWVIIGESIITYLISRLLVEKLFIKLGLGEMFGRDRFFILILVSILVRVLFDAWLLPDVAVWLAEAGAPYELRSGLYSLGLIIIALSANLFWNGGLKTGAYTLTVYLLTTWLIVQYLLIPLTNFNISTLGYMYEDLTSSILASPKAYIILVTAAFVASRLNLRYGWDFNGILIPSLLALQWYSPLKVLTTFVEAFVILLGAHLFLKLPIFRQLNIEGARKILLFFNVGFIYKILLGFAIVAWFPEYKISDYYGFGYLLSTLIAIKMFDQEIAIRMTRTTLQTSLITVLIASVVGFSLTLFTPTPTLSDTVIHQQRPLYTAHDNLEAYVDQTRKLSYQSETQQQLIPLSAAQFQQFKTLFNELKTIAQTPDPTQLQQLSAQAELTGYQLAWVEERFIVIHDATPARGWGFFIVDTQATTELTVEVPRAIDEINIASIADKLFLSLNARYLAYAGARAKRSDDLSDDVLLNSQSLFQLFHQTVAVGKTVQIRGYTPQTARQLFGVRQSKLQLDLNVSQSSIWVNRTLPVGLSLKELQDALGDFTVSWNPPAIQNRQRDTSRNGFIEVFISQDAILNIFAQHNSNQNFEGVVRQQKIDGYLQSFLAENKGLIAAKHSQQYQSPSNYQLLFFDQTILVPLLNLATTATPGNWKDYELNKLNQLSEMASRFDYEIIHYQHINTAFEYLVIKEKENQRQLHHWGTYAIKLGQASDFIIEIPTPLFEKSTFEFGTMLFEQLNARAVLIAGAHPQANHDGSARVTSSQNKNSLFNLFHQRLLSHYADKAPHAVQIRGYVPSDLSMNNTLIIAPFQYQKVNANKHPSHQLLQAQLQRLQLDTTQKQKHADEFRIQARINAQSRFIKYVENASYTELWVPSQLRYQFKRPDDDDYLKTIFDALAIPQKTVDIRQALTSDAFSAQSSLYINQLKTELQRYLSTGNIHQLYDLQHRLAPINLNLWIDEDTGQFFLVLTEQQALILVTNLNQITAESVDVSAVKEGAIEQFLDGRLQWIYTTGEQL